MGINSIYQQGIIRKRMVKMKLKPGRVW